MRRVGGAHCVDDLAKDVARDVLVEAIARDHVLKELAAARRLHDERVAHTHRPRERQEPRASSLRAHLCWRHVRVEAEERGVVGLAEATEHCNLPRQARGFIRPSAMNLIATDSRAQSEPSKTEPYAPAPSLCGVATKRHGRFGWAVALRSLSRRQAWAPDPFLPAGSAAAVVLTDVLTARTSCVRRPIA